MTVRELLKQALDCTVDLDEEVKLRIISRDEAGCVNSEKYARLARWANFGFGPSIVVEESEIDGMKYSPASVAQ